MKCFQIPLRPISSVCPPFIGRVAPHSLFGAGHTDEIGRRFI